MQFGYFENYVSRRVEEKEGNFLHYLSLICYFCTFITFSLFTLLINFKVTYNVTTKSYFKVTLIIEISSKGLLFFGFVRTLLMF